MRSLLFHIHFPCESHATLVCPDRSRGLEIASAAQSENWDPRPIDSWGRRADGELLDWQRQAASTAHFSGSACHWGAPAPPGNAMPWPAGMSWTGPPPAHPLRQDHGWRDRDAHWQHERVPRPPPGPGLPYYYGGGPEAAHAGPALKIADGWSDGPPWAAMKAPPPSGHGGLASARLPPVTGRGRTCAHAPLGDSLYSSREAASDLPRTIPVSPLTGGGIASLAFDPLPAAVAAAAGTKRLHSTMDGGSTPFEPGVHTTFPEPRRSGAGDLAGVLLSGDMAAIRRYCDRELPGLIPPPHAEADAMASAQRPISLEQLLKTTHCLREYGRRGILSASQTAKAGHSVLGGGSN